MSGTLMLVNPRKRGAHRKHRTAAQKAATRRLVALNRSRRKPSKRRASHVAAYAPNPAPRRHRRRSVAHHVRRKLRSYRRNPIGSTKPMSLLMPALTGAIGATAVNTALNYIPLPAALSTGKTRYLVRGAAAILLGMFAGKFIGHGRAKDMAVGSLTVTLHDAIKDVVGGMAPNLKLGSVGYYQPTFAAGQNYNYAALPTPSEQNISGMGEVGEYMSEYMYR